MKITVASLTLSQYHDEHRRQDVFDLRVALKRLGKHTVILGITQPVGEDGNEASDLSQLLMQLAADLDRVDRKRKLWRNV